MIKHQFVVDSGKEVEQGSAEKLDVDKVQASKSEHTILSLSDDESKEDRKLVDKKLQPSIYGVISSKPKEDVNAIDERLAPSKGHLPLGQSNEYMKNEDLDDAKKNQPLSFSREARKLKNLSEWRNPRGKRRRVLSSDVHNSCTAKEAVTKFPFSPVYKRTRSFHKTLPISNLTVQQKFSMKGNGVGK